MCPQNYRTSINIVHTSIDRKTHIYRLRDCACVCFSGRCINSTLRCNKQNDCGDNTDERDCSQTTVVCPAEKRAAPGSDLVANG